MDDALVVRDDLRSYALRRCIRFYSALVIASVTWTGAWLATASSREEILWGGAVLLLAIAAVEVGAMVVMVPMAQASARLGGGPETPIWAFAQGPWPSLLAAALFAAGQSWAWKKSRSRRSRSYGSGARRVSITFSWGSSQVRTWNCRLSSSRPRRS